MGKERVVHGRSVLRAGRRELGGSMEQKCTLVPSRQFWKDGWHGIPHAG
nr:hypothetical protein [Kibdelosporangium sp. MJ126-NF4]CTQ93219.1 hypothetical protein [Kibdelosporangium sp. MJ126-NF4]